MHFPKDKMVDKIQYGSYHRELFCYFGFKFLVPLSDCQQIAQRFDRKKIIIESRLMGKHGLGKILILLLECIN